MKLLKNAKMYSRTPTQRNMSLVLLAHTRCKVRPPSETISVDKEVLQEIKDQVANAPVLEWNDNYDSCCASS